LAVTPTVYLVDASALNRAHLDEVRDVLQPLALRSLVATCSLVDLEVLYSARSPEDYRKVKSLRETNYRPLPITQAVCDRAMSVQAQLAETSRHRGAPLPDLIIAACAELTGTTVLHYDSDYDLIASITGQPVHWVVPRGSVP
jgi:predicted nucleic acid-binding protein